jgi:endo-beta-N-acetylglucosaminidase D
VVVFPAEGAAYEGSKALSAAKATGEAKSRLQTRIDSANARLKGLQSRAKASHDADKQQMEAKLRALQDRTAKAKGEAKAGFQQRTEKLRKFWEHTKEKWGSHVPTDN